jgi:F-type H+-transporting ATPase subunit alpha
MPTKATTSFAGSANISEIGFVTQAQDYLMHLEGLPSAKLNDVVIGDRNNIGYVTALSPGMVEAQILTGERARPGDTFTIREHGLALPTHVSLFGRIVNALGQPVDNESPFPPGGEAVDLDSVAPGIHKRDFVNQQFYTGVMLIDTLLPVGRGQRELLFGDARSGKDLFLIDVVLNQKARDVICIYVALGKSDVEVRRLQDRFRRGGADEYTIIMAATATEAPPMIAITPMVACSLGEHFAKKGKTVLIIQDDLATHAKYLREISLLAARIPGRESYPANIFFEHSQMVERAGSFMPDYGGGTITMLPVVETDMENMTNLIPTNVMSMTDGHILFLSSLHTAGKYPAADASKSVTRVGKQTMMFIHKVLADKTMALLAEYAELERFSRFGSDLAAETQKTLKRGKIMQEILSQPMGVFIEASYQILFLGLVFSGFFDERDPSSVHEKKTEILETMKKSSTFSAMAAKIKEYKFDTLIEELTKAQEELSKQYPIPQKQKEGETTPPAASQPVEASTNTSAAPATTPTPSPATTATPPPQEPAPQTPPAQPATQSTTQTQTVSQPAPEQKKP